MKITIEKHDGSYYRVTSDAGTAELSADETLWTVAQLLMGLVPRYIRRAEPLKPVHYSIVPFVAICGADLPNQATSQNRGSVTCDACRKGLAHEQEVMSDTDRVAPF